MVTRRTETIAWMIVFALAICFYLASWPTHYVGFYMDDADYVVEASSSGMTALHRWPGFPFLLKPFVFLLAPHWDALKAVPLTGLVLALYLFARWMRRLFPPLIALGASAWLAWNPETVARSTAVMSEPWVLVLLLTLFTRLENAPVGPMVLGAWGSLLRVVFISLMRPEGMLVGPIVAVVTGIQRRWSEMLAVILATFVAFGVLATLFHQHGDTYLSDWRASGGVPSFSYLGHQGCALLLTVFAGLLYRFPLPTTTVSWVLCTAVALGSLAGVTRGFRNRLTREPTQAWAIVLFVIGYILMHLFWPVVSYRLVWLLLPWLVYAGASAIADRTLRLQRWATLGAIGVLTFFIGKDLAFCRTVVAKPNASLQWLRTSTASNDEILALNPSWIALETERTAVGLHRSALADAGRFRYDLLVRGVTHIYYARRPTVGANLPSTEGLLDQWEKTRAWVAQAPSSYERLYGPDVDGVMVYGVKKDRSYVQAYDIYQSALTDFASAHFAWAQAKVMVALQEEPALPEALALQKILNRVTAVEQRPATFSKKKDSAS